MKRKIQTRTILLSELDTFPSSFHKTLPEGRRRKVKKEEWAKLTRDCTEKSMKQRRSNLCKITGLNPLLKKKVEIVNQQDQHPVGVPPPQGYPPKDGGYPPPGYPPQGYPPPGYPQQGYPPPGYGQGYPAQGYPPPPPQYYQGPPQYYGQAPQYGCGLLLLSLGCFLLIGR